MTVWGHALTHLIHVHESLNKTPYLNIAAEKVHFFMLLVYPNGDGYFQQDNASCHSAGTVQNWFEEYEGEFTLLR